MNVAEFIYETNKLGISIWLEDEKIKYRLYQDLKNKQDIIEKLKINKKIIVEFLKNNNIFKDGISNLDRIYISSDNSGVLSFGQERMWFIEKYEEGTSVYNLPIVFALNKSINLDILCLSLQSLVNRHEIFRTVIKEDVDGNAYQEVKEEASDIINLSILKVINQSELDFELEKNTNYIFNLQKESPIKINFLKIVGGKALYLCIVIHHIAFDGWSFDVFLRDLGAYYRYFLYQDRRVSIELDLPNLTVQYKDFALWQKKYFNSEKNKKQLEFWKNKIAGHEPLNIMTDFSRPSKISYLGDDIFIDLDEASSLSLRNLAAQLHVSLYSLLLAAYCIMLRCFSGQNDITIGTPVANRHYSQIENLIGFFVNSLVLRLSVDPEMLITEYICKIGQEVVEAQYYQDIPFEKIVEALGIPRDTSRHPIFQVMFSMDNFGKVINENNEDFSLFSGFQLYTPNRSIHKEAKFDLTTIIDDSHQCLKICFNFAVNLYKKTTVSSFLKTYCKILNQFSKLVNPTINEMRIKDLQYLDLDEFEQALPHKLDNEYDISNKTIQSLFEEQVKLTPNKIAVVFENNTLTYAALNERANQLGHYLKLTFNIKPDDLAVLCLDKSEHILAAILAILKSGAAYVPIEPNLPDKRVKYIVESSNAKVVLTNRLYKGRLSVLTSELKNHVDILDIDNNVDKDSIKMQPAVNPNSNTTSNNLAYVIYTSGTTGHPKGVMIEHKSVLNYIFNVKSHYLISSEDTVDFSTNIGFDLTLTTTLCSLCLGSEVIVYGNQLQDLDSYKNHLNKNNINVIKLVPSYFELLIDFLPNTRVDKVILGGEKLNPIIIEKLYQVYHNMGKEFNLLIYDEYGPTESTVGACINKVYLNNSFTIGKPYDNYKIYVLDAHLNILPIGAPGEIYIGGISLARGYLNDPELTAKSFIANPFQTKEEDQRNENTRLYRTGDLGRWLSDGNLEYIGRNDFQVKINGYRIELSEIERTLSSYEGIKKAVVVVKENIISEGILPNKYLVGYYVSNTKLKEDNILAHLRSILPEYLIPKAVIRIDKIPLTSNGKLDRNLLPDRWVDSKNNYEAPRTELEKRMCSVWSEVLTIPESKIGIYDDFFRLGGDSILAIRLVSRINKECRSQLKVRDVFESKSIIKLSDNLYKDLKIVGDADSYIPFSLQRKALNNTELNLLTDIFPASYLQMGMILESSLSTNRTYHHIIGYSVKARYNKSKFLSIWKYLIRKHELLRASFILDEDGEWNVAIHKRCVLDYKVFSKNCTVQLINNEKSNGFDYSNPGIFRIIVNDVDENFDLIFSFHHAIADGWSIASLMNEFTQLYVKNRFSTKSIGLSYGEFVKNEINAIKDHSIAEFWKSYLYDLNHIRIKWKFNSDRSINSVYTSSCKLELDDVYPVHEMAKNLKISVDCIFLLAYFKTIEFFTRSSNITIGLTVNNRLEKEGGDELFGLFLNTLPFRVDLNKSCDHKDELLSIFNNKLGLQKFKHLPYGYIKSLFNEDLYTFAFNFVHYYILNESSEYIEYLEEFEKSSIPFFLNISQEGYSTFFIDITAHDDCVSKDYLEYFMLYYKRALINVIENQYSKLSLSIEDCQKLLHTWNQTDKEFCNNKTICALFEEQVNALPDNVAIIFGERKTLYRELNEKSNQLANYLRQNFTIEADTLIVLCLDRSEHILIAMLAILKAGGTYVPVDPNYPNERIKYILEDTKTKLVLTNTLYQQRLCDLYEMTNIKINVLPIGNIKFDDLLKTMSTENPNIEVKNCNLAYVIYTSGTMGNPKGVMVEHRGIVNLKCDLTSRYGMSDDEVILQFTNYVFDASVEQIVLSLLNGYTLVLVPDHLFLNKDDFYSYLNDNNITHLDATPSLLEQYDLTNVRSLRRIISGGEPLTPEAYHKLSLNRNVKIINAYGLTETSVTSLVDLMQNEKISIGSPIANTKCYVLDDNQSLLPVGVVGELYIGGIGLARGYLNNLELTNKVFITNPYQTCDEKKLLRNALIYKTGDLVRWLPDGKLEFIGRKDFQVKIRGYRIELGEIENVLSAYEGIQYSIVVTNDIFVSKNTRGSNQYLIAYYVSIARLDEEAIANYLKNKLPEYMLPKQLIYLNKLPTTIAGKLDKKSLPQPEFMKKNTYRAPKNEVERKLCEIWSVNLNLDKNNISITDDFFEIGGNSILAMKVISIINIKLSVKLSVLDLFLYRTIKSLACMLKQPNLEFDIIKRLSDDNNYVNLFMIHPGEIGSEVYIPIAKKFNKYFCCYGVDSYNLNNKDKIEDLNALANYYLQPIEKIIKEKKQDVYHLFGWSFGGMISLEIASILERRGYNKVRVYLVDTILYDEYLTFLENKIDPEALKERYSAYIMSQDHDVTCLDTVISNIDTENKLIRQNISSFLSKTTVLLFKAMKRIPTENSEIYNKYFEYCSSLEFNNIDKYVDRKNIKVIKLYNVHHYSVLQKEERLLNEIVLFNKTLDNESLIYS